MKFKELVEIVEDEPLFETGLLLAGATDPSDLRRQLSRWTGSGHVYQLKRGLYALAPPWRKAVPHPFLVANRLRPGSYVSGLSALAFFDAIPEYVAEVTSVSGGRPELRHTSLGRFSFRHLRAELMFGYRYVELAGDQGAFLATPEKALLDLVHLQPGGDERAYLEELRLNYDVLCLARLEAFATACDRPKITRAVRHVRSLGDDDEEYETL